MSLTTAKLDVKDDWVGTKDTELAEFMIQGDELAIRGCELLSKLIRQSTKGDWDRYSILLPLFGHHPPFWWKVSYII